MKPLMATVGKTRRKMQAQIEESRLGCFEHVKKKWMSTEYLKDYRK
jgi:hypothetical protein